MTFHQPHARNGVALLQNPKAVKVNVCPSESDLENPVQVCQSAVGADQKPSPQHRVDAANLRMDQIGRGRRVHDHDSVTRYGFHRDRRGVSEDSAMELACPWFEMDSRQAISISSTRPIVKGAVLPSERPMAHSEPGSAISSINLFDLMGAFDILRRCIEARHPHMHDRRRIRHHHA